MTEVATNPPLGAAVPNDWSRFLELNSKEQQQFIAQCKKNGRLSLHRKGNIIILSSRDKDIVFNPALVDGTPLFFTSEKDAEKFIAAKQQKTTRDFSWYRLCDGSCNCRCQH